MEFENLFDLSEAFKTNILVSGANASGKTRLSCAISSMLHRLGYRVLVFDVSGVWKSVSDLPYYTKYYDGIGISKLITSGIYDLSTLRLTEAKAYVEAILLNLWNQRINQNDNRPMFLVFEESETYLRNIRSMTKSQEVYRMVHVGRNKPMRIRSLLITTDLALIDASVIRLCGIRFHGFLHIEENSKRKFKSYYGKDYQRIASNDLESGDFIRLHKRKLDIVSVPLFKPRTTPQLYIERYAQEPQTPQATPKQTLIQKIRAIF